MGAGIFLAGSEPYIGSVVGDQVLDGETTATIWADEVTAGSRGDEVVAVLTPPNWGAEKAAASAKPSITLHDVGDGRYEGTMDIFYTAGTYHFAIVAIDGEDVSLPKATTVTQQAGSAPGASSSPR